MISLKVIQTQISGLRHVHVMWDSIQSHMNPTPITDGGTPISIEWQCLCKSLHTWGTHDLIIIEFIPRFSYVCTNSHEYILVYIWWDSSINEVVDYSTWEFHMAHGINMYLEISEPSLVVWCHEIGWRQTVAAYFSNWLLATRDILIGINTVAYVSLVLAYNALIFMLYNDNACVDKKSFSLTCSCHGLFFSVLFVF
jgi:hypothetical protein